MTPRYFRGSLVFAVCCVLAACGGRIQADGRPSPASNGGAVGRTSNVSGAPGVAGTSGDGAATGHGGVVALPDGGAAISLPTPIGCSAATDDSACTSAAILLDLQHVTSDAASGLSVEPLQVPDYGTRPDGYFSSYVEPDPSLWDRSARPAGACVFRLHGMKAGCLWRSVLFQGGCPVPGEPAIAPESFYETSFCEQALVPGCPSSDPWGSFGNWWYLQRAGADVELVVCAPECAVAIVGSGGACLRLSSLTK